MRAVSKQQLGTILAALRFFQRNYDGDGNPPIMPEFDDVRAMKQSDVDVLCEALNAGTHLGDSTKVTVLAMVTPAGPTEMSVFTKEADAWASVAEYAELWWDRVIPDTDRPTDPKEKADEFFGECRDGSDYEIATLELRYEQKRFGKKAK